MHFCKRKRLCTPLLEAGHSHRVRTACRPSRPRALWAGASVNHVKIKMHFVLTLYSFLLCHHVYHSIHYFATFLDFCILYKNEMIFLFAKIFIN